MVSSWGKLVFYILFIILCYIFRAASVSQWSSPLPWSLTYAPDTDQHFESSMSSANSTFFFPLPAKKKEVALCVLSMNGFNIGNEKLI